MAALDAFNKILGCVCAYSATQSHAKIIECDSSASLCEITLSDLTGNIMVFTPDEGKRIKVRGKVVHDCMSPLFTQAPLTHHNKSCDVVIVQENIEGILNVTYVDLKSGDHKGVANQFKSTRSFVRYLCALSDNIYGTNIKVSKEAYLVLTLKVPSISKRPSIPKLEQKISSNIEMPKIRLVKNKAIIPVGQLL